MRSTSNVHKRRRWTSVLGFAALVTPLIATAISLAYVLVLLDATPSGWLIYLLCMIAPMVIVRAEFSRMRDRIADNADVTADNASATACQGAP